MFKRLFTSPAVTEPEKHTRERAELMQQKEAFQKEINRLRDLTEKQAAKGAPDGRS